MIVRYGITFGGRIGGAALQAIMLACLARSLGVEGFGLYSVLISVLLFALSVSELGAGTTVLRVATEADPQRMVITAGLWRATISVFLVTVCLAVGFMIAPDDWALFLATATYAVGDALGNLSASILQGERRAGAAVLTLVVRRVLSVCPFLAGLDRTNAEIALLVSGVAGIVILLSLLWRRRARPISLVAFVQRNAAIILTTSGRSMAQLDSFVVSTVGGISLAGLFGAASRLSNPVNIGITSLIQVLVPELSSLPSRTAQLRLFRRLRLYVALFAVLLALCSLISPLITELLFGPEFKAASPAVGGVLIAAAFSAMSRVYMSWFYATRIPKSVTYGTYGINGFGLLLLATLAAFYGIWGAATAIVAWRFVEMVLLHLWWVIAERQQE